MSSKPGILNTIATHFRNGAKWLLTKPVTWLANKFSSAPKTENVNSSLSKLYADTIADPTAKKGHLLPVNPKQQPIIIFSDQHKGAKNGADDFWICEKNYLSALEYYNNQKYVFVNLGDSEEFWENSITKVLKRNKKTFEKEQLFAKRNAYYKIIGNHDLFWSNDPFASLQIKKTFEQEIPIFEGLTLRIQLANTSFDIFCTHGHQGDSQSDGNMFSKWFVSYIWGPVQAFLKINTNSASCNNNLKTLHNKMMYDWSNKQKNVALITGHTHQPVFKSLTHLESLYLKLENAQLIDDEITIYKIMAELPKRKKEFDFVNNSFKKMSPSYFNTGCCCFKDGTITGIEISDEKIRLIKWNNKSGVSKRTILEEIGLEELSIALTTS
jgi:UDP-2,3-diacylglucosamine pyrophosphatase LpxH